MKKIKNVKEMTMRQRAAFITVALVGMIGVIWYLASFDPTVSKQNQEYLPIPHSDRVLLQQKIHGRINDYSPEDPRAASDDGFRVTDFEYLSDAMVRVSYNDGLTYYIGDASFKVETDEMGIRDAYVVGFKIVAKKKGRQPGPEDFIREEE